MEENNTMKQSADNAKKIEVNYTHIRNDFEQKYMIMQKEIHK